MNPLTGVAWIAAAFLSATLFSHTVALRLLLLLCGTVLALVALVRDRHSLRPLPAIWLPFALWAAWAALSLTWSVEPARTLKELRNEIGYAGLALWMCFIGGQAGNAARVFLPLVATAATASVIVAFRDFSVGWSHYLVGLHGGPGYHSSALLILMPCVAMAAWYGSRRGWVVWSQVLVWLLGALLFASAFTTLNRTIWVGFAVQFLLLAVCILLRRRAPVGRRSKVLAISFAIMAVAGTSAALLNVQEERKATGAKPFQQDHRLLLWPEVIDHIQEKPLTGYGFGRGLLRGELRAEFRELDAHLWHAHNIFLEALLQLGVPGLVLLLLLLGATLREGWRYVCHSDDAMAACGIALIGVVAGMLVRNMTDTLLVRQGALLFWGILGVLLAWASRSARASG